MCEYQLLREETNQINHTMALLSSVIHVGLWFEKEMGREYTPQGKISFARVAPVVFGSVSKQNCV